jgi:tetratricopeptide (TPR) repeat protein
VPFYQVDRTPGGGYWVRRADGTDAVVEAGFRAGGAAVGALAGLALAGISNSIRSYRERSEAQLYSETAQSLRLAIDAQDWHRLSALGNEVIMLFETEPLGYEALAMALIGLGDPDGALEATERAEEHGGDAVHFLRASAFLAKEDMTHAIRECSRLIEDRDFRPDGFEMRAKAFLWIGDLEQALEDATQAISARPTADAYSLRGDIRWASGHLGEAISDFTRASKLDPDGEQILGKRAAVFDLLGRRAEAQSDNLALAALVDKHESEEALAEAEDLLRILARAGWELRYDEQADELITRKKGFLRIGGLAPELAQAIDEYRPELLRLLSRAR